MSTLNLPERPQAHQRLLRRLQSIVQDGGSWWHTLSFMMLHLEMVKKRRFKVFRVLAFSPLAFKPFSFVFSFFNTGLL